jgi:hypothetical protein
MATVTGVEKPYLYGSPVLPGFLLPRGENGILRFHDQPLAIRVRQHSAWLSVEGVFPSASNRAVGLNSSCMIR